MTAVSEQIGTWVNEFTGQEPAAPWLQQLREAAFQRFVDLGFPTTQVEEWRFTSVAPIAREHFPVALPKNPSRGRWGAVPSPISRSTLPSTRTPSWLSIRPF